MQHINRQYVFKGDSATYLPPMQKCSTGMQKAEKPELLKMLDFTGRLRAYKDVQGLKNITPYIRCMWRQSVSWLKLKKIFRQCIKAGESVCKTDFLRFFASMNYAFRISYCESEDTFLYFMQYNEWLKAENIKNRKHLKSGEKIHDNI